MPKRGDNGLFYCGKKLDYKCYCCDGYCGPDDGCNCTSCKKLDDLYYSPKRSYNGKYYCGRKVLNCQCCDGHCGPDDGCNCRKCKQYTILKKQQKEENKLAKMFEGMSLQPTQSVNTQQKNPSQSAIVQPQKEYSQQKKDKEKEFKSQIIRPKRQPHHQEFFQQLSSLNLSEDTVNILQTEAINDWEILNTMTKQDFVSLKIKFGDVMRILSALKK